MRFNLSQRKDVTAQVAADQSKPFPASNGARLQGTGESRTWYLDHPGFRVKALVLDNQLCGLREAEKLA